MFDDVEKSLRKELTQLIKQTATVDRWKVSWKIRRSLDALYDHGIVELCVADGSRLVR